MKLTEKNIEKIFSSMSDQFNYKPGGGSTDNNLINFTAKIPK